MKVFYKKIQVKISLLTFFLRQPQLNLMILFTYTKYKRLMFYTFKR